MRVSPLWLSQRWIDIAKTKCLESGNHDLDSLITIHEEHDIDVVIGFAKLGRHFI